MTGSMHPGMVLGGRYRLDDLLQDLDGARFWRATDTVLARSVAVHALRSADPRATPVLEAARVSATLMEPHLLKVLDCDTTDTLTWVVNEWGTGASLDILVAEHPLPPDRAAWFVREAAEAIAAVHAQGFAHGRLAPENVMITDNGSVKLIGCAIDAALHHDQVGRSSGLFAPSSAQQQDIWDLGGLLYCALTGRWAGASVSQVPVAPRGPHGLLRPRQVRAGVPRPLDSICHRILGGDQEWPLRTAHDIAAALGEYVGEEPPAEPVVLPGRVQVDPVNTRPGDWQQTPAEPNSAEQAPVPVEEPEAEPPAEPEPTRVVRSPGLTDTGTDALFPAAVPMEDIPEPVDERPLFAPVGTQRRPKRPLSAAPAPALPAAPPAPPPPVAEDTDSGWLYNAEDAEEWREPEEPTTRRWLRWPVLVGLGLLVLALAALGILLSTGNTPGSGPAASQSPSVDARSTSKPISITAVTDLDPAGDPPEENPDTAVRAIDGDPATAWRTMTYKNRPDLGGLKAGVGLVLDLGRVQQVGRVRIDLIGEPTSLSLFAARPDASQPTDVTGLDEVGSASETGPRVSLRMSQPVRTRYLVVWLTRLPPVQGGYAGQVAEIVVRS